VSYLYYFSIKMKIKFFRYDQNLCPKCDKMKHKKHKKQTNSINIKNLFKINRPTSNSYWIHFLQNSVLLFKIIQRFMKILKTKSEF
jgi:hypothetical protein